MAPIMSMCTAEQSGGIVMVSEKHREASSNVHTYLPGNLMISQEISTWIRRCKFRSFLLI